MQDVTSAPWNALVIFIFSVYQEGPKAFLLRITNNTPVNGKMVLFYSKKFSTQNKTWKFHCFTLMLSTDQCMSKQCMNFEFLWNNKTTNVSIVLTTVNHFLNLMQIPWVLFREIRWTHFKLHVLFTHALISTSVLQNRFWRSVRDEKLHHTWIYDIIIYPYPESHHLEFNRH